MERTVTVVGKLHCWPVALSLETCGTRFHHHFERPAPIKTGLQGLSCHIPPSHPPCILFLCLWTLVVRRKSPFTYTPSGKRSPSPPPKDHSTVAGCVLSAPGNTPSCSPAVNTNIIDRAYPVFSTRTNFQPIAFLVLFSFLSVEEAWYA